MAEQEHIAPRKHTAVTNAILDWDNQKDVSYPWRNMSIGWKGLIAEILLQRTRAASVIPVYEAFFLRFPTPTVLAEARVEDILDVIRPLGLAWRAPVLKALGQALDGLDSIPHDTEQLLKLPGVGPYVAAAWQSFYNEEHSLLVDSNTVRMVCRIYGKERDAETRRKRWLRDLVDDLTPNDNARKFNYNFLDLAMTVCTTKPNCAECPLRHECSAFGELPRERAR